MRVVVFREVKRIEKYVFDGNFHIDTFIIHRKRANEAPDHFQKCDYCLKKIDKEGDEQVSLINKDDYTQIFYFHALCWNKMGDN